MRKLMTVMVAMPLFVTTFGMSASNQAAAKDVANKMKLGCPTAVVDATKNLKLIAPIPAPSAARTGGRPKVREKLATNGKLKKPAAGNGDCG
jgi:hypothetical protein